MPKMKQQMHRLSRKNSVCGPSLTAERAECLSVSRRKTLVRWRRRRKVGVTLLTSVKKKRRPVYALLDEAVADAAPKQKLNTLVHKMHKHSNKYRTRSAVKELKASSSSTSKNKTGCDTLNVDVCRQNDAADNCAETTISSCSSPVIIDDSSDADCSSAADATNVCNTSAVNDACDSEGVDYFAEESSKITHGLG